MGRQKTIFHFSKQGIDLLKDFANNNATQKIMTEMFEKPELAELIENENSIAISILQSICKEFNIIGKADMQYIQTEYEYYKSLERIKPKYKNWRLNNGK